MAVVDVHVNGRVFQVACDDGQEEHLISLAKEIDERVSQLSAKMGQIGDALLILMAGLLIADELAESLEMIDELDRLGPKSRESSAENLTALIENAVGRITNIAAELEKA